MKETALPLIADSFKGLKGHLRIVPLFFILILVLCLATPGTLEEKLVAESSALQPMVTMDYTWQGDGRVRLKLSCENLGRSSIDPNILLPENGLPITVRVDYESGAAKLMLGEIGGTSGRSYNDEESRSFVDSINRGLNTIFTYKQGIMQSQVSHDIARVWETESLRPLGFGSETLSEKSIELDNVSISLQYVFLPKDDFEKTLYIEGMTPYNVPTGNFSVSVLSILGLDSFASSRFLFNLTLGFTLFSRDVEFFEGSPEPSSLKVQALNCTPSLEKASLTYVFPVNTTIPEILISGYVKTGKFPYVWASAFSGTTLEGYMVTHVQPNSTFPMLIRLHNTGFGKAYNIAVTFTGCTVVFGDASGLIFKDSRVLDIINPYTEIDVDSKGFYSPKEVSINFDGVNVTYYDENSTQYTNHFAEGIGVAFWETPSEQQNIWQLILLVTVPTLLGLAIAAQATSHRRRR